MTRFWKCKIDANDTLYSRIIRFGQVRCCRCGRERSLQCCHITSRGEFATRFLLEPVRGAIHMCSICHSWLDSKKLRAVILFPEKRVFTETEEGYTFLVKRGYYTWDDLLKLVVMGRTMGTYKFPWQKKMIGDYLKLVLKKLEKGL